MVGLRVVCGSFEVRHIVLEEVGVWACTCGGHAPVVGGRFVVLEHMSCLTPLTSHWVGALCICIIDLFISLSQTPLLTDNLTDRPRLH